MKAFYCLILLFCSNSIISQSIDSIYIKAQIDSLVILHKEYLKENKNTEAKDLLSKARDLSENTFGKESHITNTIIGIIAKYHLTIGDFENAESFSLQAKDLRYKLQGRLSEGYATSLSNLAHVYDKMGKYEEAIVSYKESIEIMEELFGNNDVRYAIVLNNLAIIHKRLGDYDEAELCYLKSLQIVKEVLSVTNPNYALLLNNLAVFYKTIGRYESAEDLYKESKSIQDSLNMTENPDYASTLFNLGTLYSQLGQYQSSEKYLKESMELRARILGKEHPDYARSLNNLGKLYKNLGLNEKAELYFLKCQELWEQTLGSDHPEYAALLSNLGSLYLNMDKLKDAEKALQSNLAINEKVYGIEHPKIANSLSMLGAFYMRSGNLRSAEECYKKSIKIREQYYGKEHSSFANATLNLASLYSANGETEKAEIQFLESLSIIEEILSKSHPTFSKCITHIASFYLTNGQFEKARKFIELSFELEKDQILNAQKHLSEIEMAQYINKFKIKQDELFSYSLDNKATDLMISMCYDYSLFYKGYLLEGARRIKNFEYKDSSLTEEFNLLKSYSRRLSKEHTKSIEKKDKILIKELEEKINNVEKGLASKIANFDSSTEQVNWKQLYSALDTFEAAIEFVHFNSKKEEENSETVYAALLINKQLDSPVFIKLFKESELEKLIGSNVTRRSDYVNDLYSYNSRGTKAILESQRTLYEMVWEKLEIHLNHVKTIYFSPSGLLHRINIAAIPVNKKEVLAKRFNLVQLNSCRQIINSEHQLKELNNAALFGGITYDLDTSRQINITQDSLSSFKSRGSSWSYLDYSGEEVQSIAETLNESGIDSDILISYNASEEQFRELGKKDQNTDIIHLATHGYFFPDPSDTSSQNSEEIFELSSEPMIRSGIIMSGGNHTWEGNEPIVGKEDGILTAYEISQLELSNTQLVVLSACETGLGSIKGNEGVYGLQRAFKIAGAKYLIMSLWQIPDRQTMAFMTRFYENWISDKMPIREAFQKTQLEMRDRFFDPYAWAGFILIE